MAPVPKDNELHRIAVTGIIWKDDADGVRRFLITKRAPHKKVLPNRWTVPGGGLEVQDYIDTEPTHVNEQSPQWVGVAERALRREIREEVGLEVETPEYLLDVTFIRPDGVPVVVLSYYCKYRSGDVVLDEDATEFAWISITETNSYEFVSGVDQEITLADARISALNQ